MCELLTNFTVFVDPSDRPDVSIERGEATVTMQPAMVLRHDNWGPTPEVALSFGSAIHSRMILRRAACSGFMPKSFGPNGGRRQHKHRAAMRKDRCREVNAPARRSLQMLSSYPAPFWLAGGVF